MKSNVPFICVLILASAGAACRDPAGASGTALFVREQHDVADVTQFRCVVQAPGAEPIGPVVIPEAPGDVLGSGQTFRLLLADELGGSEVELTVEALAGGEVVARGAGSAFVETGLESEVDVTLVPVEQSSDGGTDAGVPDAGETGDAGTDGGTDAGIGECGACDGCCDGTTCLASSFSGCGAGGERCVACDDERADSCTDGACLCGDSAQCEVGQKCVAGTCVCNPSTCAGCCDGDRCLAGTDVAACGTGGSTCEICPAGQTCDSGACSGCDATTCPDGCCSGSTCHPSSDATCGVGGNRCVACDGARSDACGPDGTCRCGAGAECAAGQRCDGGACVCDAVSCATGCCDAGKCRPSTKQTCGTAGGACLVCNPAKSDACANGSCVCGSSAACGDGQRCEGGQCVCDSTSCPGGCCDGTVCKARSLSTCGAPGNTCFSCDATTANNCSSTGTCQCGSGAACGPGQRCVGGACVCDGVSCPDGCCNGTNCLPGNLGTACGTGGSACQACPSGESCTDGACSGCNPGNCATGCCSGSTCFAPAIGTCGTGGNKCVACDTARADQCASNGECRCGLGPSCAIGQRCDGGACLCDAASCPTGCCAANQCQAGNTTSACGTSGGACGTCTASSADSCSGGSCGCGTGPACGVGQRCVGGACVCDSTSCPDGCCEGNTCTAPTLAKCGSGGASCGTCNSLRADQCAGGACKCGTGAACVAGQACVNGLCVCNPTSCQGCCDGNVCRSGTTLADCGSGGGGCFACNSLKADNCSNGGCRCGTGPACSGLALCGGGKCGL